MKHAAVASVIMTPAGEVSDWQGHSPERLKQMRDHLTQLRERGVEAIED